MCNITLINKTTGAPDGLISMVVVTVMLFLLALFGIIGNLGVIVVVARSKKLRSVFILLIVSLSCSDLLSATASFLRLYCFTWAACGTEADASAIKLACQIGWRTTNWMTLNTAVHITGFAAFRFVSIRWPHMFHKITHTRIRIFIVLTWFLSFVFGFAMVFFKELRPNRMRAYVAVYVILSVIMTSLCVATASLILKLRQRRKSMAGCRKSIRNKRRQKENQKIIQLALIVGSFLLGYIPRAAFTLRVMYVLDSEQLLEGWVFAVVQYFCLRISECLNPVFYNIGSIKLLDETKKTLKQCFPTVSCFQKAGFQQTSVREQSMTALEMEEP